MKEMLVNGKEKGKYIFFRKEEEEKIKNRKEKERNVRKLDRN